MHCVLFVIFFDPNRPNVSTIVRFVHKFQQTGTVGNVKTPLHDCSVGSAVNIAVVRDTVAEERQLRLIIVPND